jgi:hypothetical protein
LENNMHPLREAQRERVLLLEEMLAQVEDGKPVNDLTDSAERLVALNEEVARLEAEQAAFLQRVARTPGQPISTLPPT